ncbi:hypothetical protein D3C81_1393320 [compost metagenome]
MREYTTPPMVSLNSSYSAFTQLKLPAASSLGVTLNDAASSIPVEVCWPACSVVLGTVEEGTEMFLRTMR